jgi:malonyl-CoA/methylmalonyl-CoA synthetase
VALPIKSSIDLTMAANSNAYLELERVLQRAPDHVALEFGDRRAWTYGELHGRVVEFSHRLQRVGLRPGDRVLVQVDKSPEALLLYLACLRCSLVYVPLNTAYQQAELEHFLRDARPRLVVCRPSARELFVATLGWDSRASHTLAADGSGTFVDLPHGPPTETETALVAASDLAVIIYTSGTTGRSKGAMVTHGNLVSNARTLIDLWQFSSSDVLLHALPVFHIHGLFVANHCALFSGARIVWHSKFDPRSIIRDLPRATVFMGVPTFYSRLLEQPDFGQDLCRAMRLFISGSAPLLVDTFSTFEQRTGHRILERYGMSEAGMISSNPLHGERRAGTVGMPLRAVDVRIADEQDLPLPPGQPGAIQIRGPNVFAGYWDMPEKTAEEFTPDGYFRTGDVGVLDPQRYLSIVGRAKDLIITGGYNVYPKEIELVLDTLPGVAESAVIGVPDPDFGEAVTAVVVCNGKIPVDEMALIALIKQQLANYKVPKRLHVVDELPRNAMGKVQKTELRKRFAPP